MLGKSKPNKRMIFINILILLTLHDTIEAAVGHPLLFDISSCFRNESNTDERFASCMKIFREQDKFNYNLLSQYFVKRSSYHGIVEDFRKEILPLVSAVEQIQKDIKMFHEPKCNMNNKNKTNNTKQKSSIVQFERTDHKLKSFFFKDDEQIFSTKERCIEFCFNATSRLSNEVCQVKYKKQQNEIESFKCRTSTVRSKYLNSFPNRYLDENRDDSVEYEIYYNNNSERMTVTLPLILYRLDNISRNMNLGTLDAVKYQMNMGKKPLQFNCNSTFSNDTFLRLKTSEPMLRGISEYDTISANHSSQFTAMASFRIESGSGFLIRAKKWNLWISTFSNILSTKIVSGVSKSDLNIPDITIGRNKWYTVTLRVNETSADIFIDNKLERSVALNETMAPLDYYFAVGYLYGGCIANFVYIPHALPDKEVIQYVQILTDSSF
jgi:hypothetical protein